MKPRLVAAAVTALVMVGGAALGATTALPIAAVVTQTADWLDIDDAFADGYPLGDAETEGLSVRDVETHTASGAERRSGHLNGAMMLEVKGDVYSDADDSVETDGDAYETVTSTGRIKGFQATVEYGFWLSNRPVGRAIYSFRNPKRVTRKITLRVGTSLAWDGSASIVSEGTVSDPLDPSIDPSDSWFFASDTDTEDFRGVIFGLGDGTNSFDEVPDDDSGTLIQTFSFKIKPKKTKSVMIFVQPVTNTAISGTAVTEAENYNDGETLASSSSGRVDDLTAKERAQVVNWDLPPPAV